MPKVGSSYRCKGEYTTTQLTRPPTCVSGEAGCACGFFGNPPKSGILPVWSRNLYQICGGNYRKYRRASLITYRGV